MSRVINTNGCYVFAGVFCFTCYRLEIYQSNVVQPYSFDHFCCPLIGGSYLYLLPKTNCQQRPRLSVLDRWSLFAGWTLNQQSCVKTSEKLLLQTPYKSNKKSNVDLSTYLFFFAQMTRDTPFSLNFKRFVSSGSIMSCNQSTMAVLLPRTC